MWTLSDRPIFLHKETFNYPQSSGSIHIGSAEEIEAPILPELGLLSDPSDVMLLVWAYKRSRENFHRMPSFVKEVASSLPRFPESSKARCTQRTHGAIGNMVYKNSSSAESHDMRYTYEMNQMSMGDQRRPIGPIKTGDFLF